MGKKSSIGLDLGKGAKSVPKEDERRKSKKAWEVNISLHIPHEKEEI